jgi:chemotaxis protein CheD
MQPSSPHPVAAGSIWVGVGDFAVSGDPLDVLTTSGLGSCIGIAAFDPAARIGGILHFMLPDSNISPKHAAAQPGMFADTGLPEFFRALASLGATPETLRLLVAGGARVLTGEDPYRIGESNLRAALDYLSSNGLTVQHTSAGGSLSRSLTLELATGAATVKLPQAREEIILGAIQSSQTTRDLRAG